MPSQSASGDPTSGGQVAAMAFPPGEWELLTHLPARVIVAATSAEPDAPRRTVAEGLAGLDAIAAGRAFDSDLVRAVVSAIYAEADDDRPAAEDPPASPDHSDRALSVADVLDACRRATGLLAARADPADSAAYRQWVQSVAARACGAARSGGLLGLGGERVSAAERRFLDDLAVALALR
ncbi:hypothetical protein [Phytohabitans suffuscus]